MRYGLPPARSPDAQVAQLVEHATENRSVGGSIPPLGTIPPNPLRSPERPNSSQLCSYDSVLAGFLVTGAKAGALALVKRSELGF
jgi:hypothetical protein